MAGELAAELEYIVQRMRHPLFITFTMKHDATVSSANVATLLSAFGKFRHRKLWKKRCGGGVAQVELTGEKSQWHPHLHAVVDSYWFSLTTAPPPRHFTLEQKKAVYKKAATEVGELWAKQLKQPTASIRIKRAAHGTISKEVTKYTVKAEDLIESPVPIGDIIRCLDRRRALRTFGNAHGKKVAGIRQEAARYAKQKKVEWQESNPRVECCPCPEFALAEFADHDGIRRKHDQKTVVSCKRFDIVAEAKSLARSGRHPTEETP